MNPLTLTAPAKLNLTLRILGRRDDGFHEVDTLMVRLPGLADRLVFEAADAFGFECGDPTLPSDDGNLVVRAVRAYQSAASVPAAFRVVVEKHIPHGAGLGGGSSDAAAALLALNRLHDGALAADRLSAIAAGLGSDVPFFLAAGAARCTGRGEVITPVAAPPAMPVLLLKPEFGVSTADAYGRLADAAPLPGVSYAPQDLGWGCLENDLERPVFAKHRFLAELKQWLAARREVRAVLMSGSGSTLFAVLRDPAEAAPLAAAARLELDPRLWSWHGMTGE